MVVEKEQRHMHEIQELRKQVEALKGKIEVSS